jgi:riboflavin synthase
MFTGIVTGTGIVTAVTPLQDGARLEIRLPGAFAAPGRGDSVAVNGACLTVVEPSPEAIRVEAIAETLRRTTIGELRVGDRVNLELALALGDRLAGHWVQGHVDGTARLVARRTEGISERFELELDDPTLARYLVPKGSIAVAGVSLTLGEVSGRRFSVYLIPHTLGETTLGGLATGGRVNIEIDILAKYVAHWLAPHLPATANEPAARELLDLLPGSGPQAVE